MKRCLMVFREDWDANPSDYKARLILLMYRCANILSRRSRLVVILFSPYIVLYKIIVEWLMCVELHWRSSIGGGLSLFHGLGVPLLLGCSRKSYIAALSNDEVAEERLPGSLAGVLLGASQGVHIFRVHDVAETVQALKSWSCGASL